MRTFYITLLVLLGLVAWLLNKPIAKQAQVARSFSDSEIEYLEKNFNYAMENARAGEYSDWSVAAVNGRIAAGAPYRSKQKAACREYVEVARTYDAQKVESGVACKRQGKDGWCRIPKGNPESCALEVMESSLKKRARFAILAGSQAIDSVMGMRVNMSTDGLVPNAPSISTPSLHAPDINTPDIEPGDFRPPMPWDKE